MNRLIFCSCCLVIGLLGWSSPCEAGDVLESYNVVWDSQSSNPSESMPVGGGDVGLNVWVENDELLFYIGRSGTFDENNHMLKLGRVRIRLSPNPFGSSQQFRQELKLNEGLIEILGKTPGGASAKMRLWVEVFRPVIHVDVESDEAVVVEAQYEGWRNAAREIPGDCRKSRYPALGLVGYPGKVTMHADHVAHEGDCVLWYHSNDNDDLILDKEAHQQGLDSVKDRIWNPLKGLTFGGLMKGESMVQAGASTGRYGETDFVAWKLRSASPTKTQKLRIYLHTEQIANTEQWTEGLDRLIAEADRAEKQAWQKHQQWWKDFWQRSYVFINSERPDDKDVGWQIGRNYQLFRYMLGCNAYGEWPTKFNGSFFTYDPLFVKNKRGVKTETPDFRTWGGGSFTAQNQRLVYWPMLKNGDFDMTRPQFEFYRRALAAAELRTQVYWGHGGCSFTEQLENYGLPIGSCYGWLNSTCRWGQREPDTPVGVQSMGVVYQFGHQLDFSFMILEYYRYSGADISLYIPFIESSVTFFDEHYRYREKQRSGKELDENGHLVIFPSRACESYVDAKNPADVIAGLKAVLTRLLDLPEDLVPTCKKEKFGTMLERIPPLPIKEKDGKPYLAGAESWRKFSVGEIPELYSVFPYGLYGVGKADLQLARYTWTDCLRDRQKDARAPWYQGGVFTARLGLTDQAKAIAIVKLADSGLRFPAFGDGDDWSPDHNSFGVGMIGLQEMLMQTTGEKIHLLPAWPKDWDVDFKLHAPYQTIIEGSVRGGEMWKLQATPQRRLDDVKIMKTR